jgi:hypothetical protein
MRKFNQVFIFLLTDIILTVTSCSKSESESYTPAYYMLNYWDVSIDSVDSSEVYSFNEKLTNFNSYYTSFVEGEERQTWWGEYTGYSMVSSFRIDRYDSLGYSYIKSMTSTLSESSSASEFDLQNSLNHEGIDLNIVFDEPVRADNKIELLQYLTIENLQLANVKFIYHSTELGWSRKEERENEIEINKVELVNDDEIHISGNISYHMINNSSGNKTLIEGPFKFKF